MKKPIYTAVFIITLLLINFGQVIAQNCTYVYQKNGLTEFLYTENPLKFMYSSSEKVKSVGLKIVEEDIVNNIYKVSFPNDEEVYVLRMEENKIYFISPDSTKKTFSRIGDTDTYWEGTINGNLKIQMYLTMICSRSCEGWYYDESQGSKHKIKLKGSFDMKTFYINTFTLEEFVNGKKTGEIKLESTEDVWFIGQWKGTNGKTFPIKIKSR